VLARLVFSALHHWGTGAVLIQPDLALVVTAIGFLAEIGITRGSWSDLASRANNLLAVPSIRHIRVDGWLPTCGSGPVPRLVLLSQPRC
jgi:hypothetical protein